METFLKDRHEFLGLSQFWPLASISFQFRLHGSLNRLTRPFVFRPSTIHSIPQITFTSGSRDTLIILTFRSTEGVCRQALSEFSHRTIYFYNPRAKKFSPNRVDYNYVTNYSTTKKLSNSPELIEVGTLQSDANFCIFSHREHNYARQNEKRMNNIKCGHNDALLRAYLPFTRMTRLWNRKKTNTRRMYEFARGRTRRRPRNGHEWNRPIIRILILSDTINQRNASGFYPHSLFRSSLYGPPKRTARFDSIETAFIFSLPGLSVNTDELNFHD